jgi:hypothetical protein
LFVSPGWPVELGLTDDGWITDRLTFGFMAEQRNFFFLHRLEGK